MPTNRAKHPGGERIKQGSEEEKVLLAWVKHLASLSPEQIAKLSKAEEEQTGEQHALSVRRRRTRSTTTPSRPGR
ncbi:MAG: hypothetical protein R2724_21015 [Bryobacterales bacterium]